ncbi:hypothetical protein [Mesobacterium pallidum]|uniref:hypothetical protein n=1 Tax=Mesobacterium pallidum TaxID=2872037 RepID=UPI001EE2B14A|nr:hypothetical protein [Mesobacterium pallidum]
MTQASAPRGAAPVGLLTELGAFECAAILYLRLWCDSIEAQRQVGDDFARVLGRARGRNAARSLGQLCELCSRYGRRPMARHQVGCQCLGGDESCFAQLVAAAADGDRDDAMMLAALIVRADVASALVAFAESYGLALRSLTRACLAEIPARPDTAPTLH